MSFKEKFGKSYDKYYKHLVIAMLVLLVLALVYLFYFYGAQGDILKKDITLSGGTSVTVFSEVDVPDLRRALSSAFTDFSVRTISDLRTGEQIAFIVEIAEEPEVIVGFLEDYLGLVLDSDNSSVEFTGSSLGEGFYRQLRFAVILAFVLMALVVFIIFRTFIPSFAVVLSAFADIAMTLAVVNLMGVSVSSAGIVAFLMLIGYSVDSDILLTTRILRNREGSINERMFGAFKTGMTMTLTSLIAILVSLIVVYNVSEVLRQIFLIISIGLFIDIFNTWLGNAGIIKWYAERKRL